MKEFLCSKGGIYKPKNRDKDIEGSEIHKRMGILKIGCKVKVLLNVSIKNGKWYIRYFIEDHNHVLTTLSK